jgi:DNA-binding NtrC family response regulator
VRNNRIIIAEDDELAGELLKKILVTEGYDVMLFPDGAQALRWYCDNPCPVVLTDLAMPAMSGGSLIDAIKEINENQVILVVTSYSDPATIIEIMKKGVDDYIIKPIEQNILIDSVKKAFEAAKLRSLKKTVENKQQESCSFLCKVFNGASHAIVAIDDNTNIVAYNQAAEI